MGGSQLFFYWYHIHMYIYIYIHIFVYIPSHAIKFPYLFIVILSPSQAQSKYPLNFQIILHISSYRCLHVFTHNYGTPQMSLSMVITTYIPGTELHLHLPTPRVTGHRELQVGGTIGATGIAETDGLHQFLPGISAVFRC